MKRSLSAVPVMAPLAAALLLLAQPAAHAGIVAADSNGAGVVLDAKLLGASVATATLPGPVTVFGVPLAPAITGTAAAGSTATGTPYSSSDAVATAIVQAHTVATVVPYTTNTSSVNLTAQALYGTASFDGTTVLGNGGVTNLGLGLSAVSTLDLPLAPAVDTNLWSMSLGAQALETTSTIQQVGSSLMGSNTLNSFAGLTLSFNIGVAAPLVLDLSAYTLAYLTANPNTHAFAGLLDPLGLSLVLNEQFNTCSGLAACFVETNAVHLIANPLTAGIADINLKLGHSFAEVTNAQVTAVPEPRTWALMGLGLAMLSVGVRRNAQRSRD